MANQYTYSVPFTEKELFEDYINCEMTQREIAQKYHTSQRVVWRAMKKMKLQARPACKRMGQAMRQNNNWRGGRIFVPKKTPIGHRFLNRENGYWKVRIPNHPHAGKNGYVFEHMVIALKNENRTCLTENECVHHKDFNKQNNIPENLCICDIEQHRWFHGHLENVMAKLLKLGIVSFNLKRGYFISEGGDNNA